MNKKFKNLFRLLLLMTILLLSSCMTYMMPAAMAPADDALLGTYYWEGEEGLMEIVLFSDGYFMERVFLAESDMQVTFVGTYRVERDKNHIEFYHEKIASEMNHSAFIKDDDTLIFENMVLDRIDKNTENITKAEEAQGSYFLEYYDEERVLIKMTLLPDGKFEEISRYPESDEEYRETGTYDLSIPSGAIYFHYDNWPEGNGYGIVDVHKGILYGYDGEYHRIGIDAVQESDIISI